MYVIDVIKKFKVTHAVRNKNRIRQIRSLHYLAIYPVLLSII